MSNDSFKFSLPLVLDGATGSNLIARGLPSGVCVEKWVEDNPEVLKQLQREFYSVGADVVYAPTFSANYVKLEHYSLEDEVESLCKNLVSISKSVAGEFENKLVAGDISPTGEFCEPFGMMSFDRMIEVFKQQGKAIYEAGADYFAVETMMSLCEIRAAVIALREFPLPVFVTITVDESGHTLTGATPLSCLISLQDMGIAAFGLNCSNGPEAMSEQIEAIYPYAKIPLIAKPNAGQPVADDESGCTYDISADEMGEKIKAVLKAGAQIVGGCCGNTPEHLEQIAKAVREFDYNSVDDRKQSVEFVAASESDVFFMNFESMSISEPIACEMDMSDVLLEIEDETYDAIKIVVENADDGYFFALNAHMCKLPVVFKAHNAQALENALKFYNGKALVDSQSSVDEDTLRNICAQYGAIIY